MNRREMLRSSVIAMVASQLPGLAGAQRSGQTAALDPLPDYLATYRLPEGVPNDPTKVQTFTFDIVEWGVGRNRTDVTNAAIGSLTVKRQPGAGETVYSARRIIRKDETLAGEFTCSHDTLRTVRKWRLDQALLRAGTPNQQRLVATRQEGTVTNAGYTLSRDGGVFQHQLALPIVCRYGLIDALPTLDLGDADRFAFLEDASGVRHSHRLRLDGRHTIAGTTMRSILQTGTGTLPIHWIVDPEGRPLFITTFLLSLALTRVAWGSS